jgi:arsenate reductase
MDRSVSRLLPALGDTVQGFVKMSNQLPKERQMILGELTRFVQKGIDRNENVFLNFICTHNSRRSHLAQLWAQTAAYYYGIPGVECYSGGTEATAFNPRAVAAMREAGFDIQTSREGENPVYQVMYATDAPVVIAFSKKYDDAFNPAKDFAAVMTCSHADENCPLVIGATARIAILYDDPKAFDGTPFEAAKYRERVLQIGVEMFYAFSQVIAQRP